MKTALLPVIVLFAACVSLPTEIAEWARSPQALRQMFPDGAYLAQRGRE
jgi:starvation-inducible outer membrane lipoprotein